MTRTHIATWLMTPFFMLLSGCQPDTSPKQAAGSAAVSTSASSQVPATPQPVAAAQPVAAKEESKGVGGGERALAQKSGCFACHTIEKKLVGPAWIEIAAKYRGQKDAEAKLIAKVAKGGSGVWGSTPMPPNSPKVGDSDIKVLVRFILSLK